MVITEYLAISAIFLTGLLVGVKIKAAIIDFQIYIAERKKYN